MIWYYHKKDHLIMVYGFESNPRHYDAVLTLHIKNDSTLVYGFLSKVSVTPDAFRGLYECLQKAIPTKYMIMEVLPEHAHLYKIALPIVNTKAYKTFNGIDSELLKIDLKQPLKV